MDGRDWSTAGEDELVECARAGSHEAMVELYTRHRSLIIGFVVRMTGDRELADEVFAATFATFFGHLHRYRARGRLAAYLLKVARSRLADEVRARGRLCRRLPIASPARPELDEPIDTRPEPVDAAARAELSGRADRALSRLSEPLREVVILRLYEDLDYRTIAQVVGAGEATVRSRMRYALESMRRILGDAAMP
jgi:RNA polymerase sigma-70 factor (ECF subfamily)